jgi:hypothetical protein
MNVSLWDPHDAERELREQLDAACELILDYGRRSMSVVKAEMLLAGFHRHHGAWRQRRNDRSNNDGIDG